MNQEVLPYKNIVQKNGYKFTHQKQILLETILTSDMHLNVQEIYKKVKDKNIGIATIYRNLKVFEDLGIVKAINVNGTSFYEIKIFSKKPLHIHFKCLKCNSIIDINDINDATLYLEYLKLNRRVEENTNLEIYDANIMLIGLCNECREEKTCQGQQNLGG